MKIKKKIISRESKNTRPINNRGYSLIEVIIAIAVLSIGILGVSAMQSRALRSKTFSASISEATRELNQSTAEWLLSLPFDDTNLDADNTYGPSVSTDGKYSTSYSVTSSAVSTDLKQVAVTTSWNDMTGSHSSTLTFIKDQTL
jgi:prepilin-type N-terminal cleavage/methylation domain-containing protein